MSTYYRGDVVMIQGEYIPESHVCSGTRPYVIVQNDIGNQHSPTTIVVPLTTNLKRVDMPTHVAIVWKNLKPSVVMCEQIRVMDISEDWELVCHLPDEIMCHIDEALANAFHYGEAADHD